MYTLRVLHSLPLATARTAPPPVPTGVITATPLTLPRPQSLPRCHEALAICGPPTQSPTIITAYDTTAIPTATSKPCPPKAPSYVPPRCAESSPPVLGKDGGGFQDAVADDDSDESESDEEDEVDLSRPRDLPLTLSILEMIRVKGMKKDWQWSTILKYTRVQTEHGPSPHYALSYPKFIPSNCTMA